MFVCLFTTNYAPNFRVCFQWKVPVICFRICQILCIQKLNVAFLLVRQKFRRILVPTFSFFLLPFFILSSGNVFLTLFVSEFNVKVLVIFSNLVQRSNFQFSTKVLLVIFRFSTKVLLIIFSYLVQRSYE